MPHRLTPVRFLDRYRVELIEQLNSYNASVLSVTAMTRHAVSSMESTGWLEEKVET